MVMKREQFKHVLMELKALFEKERCLIPQLYPECEFEGKILLGCELIRSYMRQKRTTTTNSEDSYKFEYPDFVICGLFESGNSLLYGNFSKLAFERGVKFVGEYQWRLTGES